MDKLNGFASEFGRSFYGIPAQEGSRDVVLKKTGPKVVAEQYTQSDLKVVPFWAGKELNWEIESAP